MAARSKASEVQQLACWDYGFEWRQVRGCLFLVNVVCCKIDVSVA